MIRTLVIILACLPLFAQQGEDNFYRGIDVSFLQRVEDAGGTFKKNGVQRDALEIFAESGVNAVRLRIWNNPTEGYSDLQKTLEFALRVKAAGLKLLLDFHYSDTWADPGNQTKPAAWVNLDYATLLDSVYAYSNRVTAALVAQQTPPDLVQIGNEIICGMLWNEGRVCDAFNTPQQWGRLAQLIGRGAQGVQDALSSTDSTKIMIHIDRGGDNGSSRWFFDNLLSQNIEFDMIGQSFYPWWHGTLADLDANLTDLANRYGKEIVVVETAYPWTLNFGDNFNNIVGSNSQLLSGYPASQNGQRWFVRDVLNIVRNLPNNLGRGIFYWEAAWIPTPQFGSVWENLAFFDFAGNALGSMDVFLPPVTGIGDSPDYSVSSFELTSYPNPFNPSTTVEFNLERVSSIELKIYDSTGKLVQTLLNTTMQAGTHSVIWNGLNSSGNSVASGQYWAVLTSNGQQANIPLVLIR